MKKVFAFVLLLLLITPTLAVASTYDKFDIYLQPTEMTKDGDIKIYVRVRNIAQAVPSGYDGVSAVAFKLKVDTSALSVVNTPSVGQIDDTCLVKSKGDLLSNDLGDGVIKIMFIDNSLGGRLITYDGALFYFVLKAKRPSQFFNSDDVYRLTFETSSIEALAYKKNVHSVHTIRNIQTWDLDLGSYVPQTLLPPLRVERAESIIVSEGSDTLVTDIGEMAMDTWTYMEDGILMVPVRFVAEAAGCGLRWRQSYRTCTIASPNGRVISVKEDSDVMIVDSEAVIMSSKCVIRDGRLFLPIDSFSLFCDDVVKLY